MWATRLEKWGTPVSDWSELRDEPHNHRRLGEGGHPPQPFNVVPGGLNWQQVDWGYASAFSCYCDWVANSSRVKAYYHYTIVESAKFKCEPCDKIVNKTRTRTEDIWKYEEGGPIMPTQTKRTWGKPFQTGEFADDPSTDSSVCTCRHPTN